MSIFFLWWTCLGSSKMEGNIQRTEAFPNPFKCRGIKVDPHSPNTVPRKTATAPWQNFWTWHIIQRKRISKTRLAGKQSDCLSFAPASYFSGLLGEMHCFICHMSQKFVFFFFFPSGTLWSLGLTLGVGRRVRGGKAYIYTDEWCNLHEIAVNRERKPSGAAD